MNEIQKEPIKEAIKEPVKPTGNGKISYDDFAKVEIKAGKILSAEKIPDTDKLLKLSVDFGESVPRQIVSGISLYFPDTNTLVGKTCMFVTNLEPRMIRGFESNGMLFALSTSPTPENPGGSFSLLEPNPTIPVGTKAK
jgi:methionyl-tRNA synthetase